MTFELTADVQVTQDDHGNVRHLEHLQQPVVAIAPGREGFAEDAARLLSATGLTDALGTRARRLMVREVTVDIELD